MEKPLPSRRSFLQAAGAAALPLAAGLAAGERPPTEKPNILFIMADDLGPEWLSCYGSEEVKTPNLDKLAAGGIRFDHSVYSMPKCTPTRVSLLTGQYPFRTGWINHWDVPRWGAGCHFDPKHYTTFARILKSAGYATAAAGKWQINDFRLQPNIMRRHGFDEWCMWTGFETRNPPSANRYWDPYINTPEGSTTRKGRFGTDVFVEFLVEFMRRHRHEPMLLYFPMCLPHGPLTTTPLEPDVKDREGRYKAMIRYIDHAVGRLVAALEELGLRERTIVFFTSDNGSGGNIVGRMKGRVIRGGKGKLTESGACAPFIVNCPGLVPAGLVTNALSDFTDMLPTFAELAGAPLPEALVLDGHSIAKFILGKAKDTPREWIMAMGGGVARLTTQGVRPVADFNDRVVRDKRWKLWIVGGRSTRLHDLTRDPDEKENLIESSDPAALAARKRLEAVVASFPKKDAWPRYDPLPPQPWDRKPTSGGEKKTRRRKRRP